MRPTVEEMRPENVVASAVEAAAEAQKVQHLLVSDPLAAHAACRRAAVLLARVELSLATTYDLSL